MTDSSDISSVSVYTCSSDDSQFDLQSSDLNQCIQGIDDSTTFVQNIDFEAFSHIDDDDHHTDDSGGNDDNDNGDFIADETDNNADVHTDGGGGGGNDDDDDDIADETCESSESENICLVKLKRKKTKEKYLCMWHFRNRSVWRWPVCTLLIN